MSYEGPKEKLIDRIKRENIKYKESFNKSLINQYALIIYLSKILLRE